MTIISFRAARVRVAVVGGCAALVASLALPASAQMGPMQTRLVDAAANAMVNSIQSESCSDFAAMLKKRKSTSSRTGSMLKNNPAARQRFINKVAGPLMNKMIDCDLLPGH